MGKKNGNGKPPKDRKKPRKSTMGKISPRVETGPIHNSEEDYLIMPPPERHNKRRALVVLVWWFVKGDKNIRDVFYGPYQMSELALATDVNRGNRLGCAGYAVGEDIIHQAGGQELTIEVEFEDKVDDINLTAFYLYDVRQDVFDQGEFTFTEQGDAFFAGRVQERRKAMTIAGVASDNKNSTFSWSDTIDVFATKSFDGMAISLAFTEHDFDGDIIDIQCQIKNVTSLASGIGLWFDKAPPPKVGFYVGGV